MPDITTNMLNCVELLLFAGMLIAIAVVDVRRRVIPNGCIITMFVVRVICLLASGEATFGNFAYYTASAIGIGTGLLVFTIVADKLFASESMGGGDIKLYSVSGFYFGWQWGLVVVALSCFLGVVFAAMPFGEKDERLVKRSVPFGPAIAVACFVVMFLSHVA